MDADRGYQFVNLKAEGGPAQCYGQDPSWLLQDPDAYVQEAEADDEDNIFSLCKQIRPLTEMVYVQPKELFKAGRGQRDAEVCCSKDAWVYLYLWPSQVDMKHEEGLLVE